MGVKRTPTARDGSGDDLCQGGVNLGSLSQSQASMGGPLSTLRHNSSATKGGGSSAVPEAKTSNYVSFCPPHSFSQTISELLAKNLVLSPHLSHSSLSKMSPNVVFVLHRLLRTEPSICKSFPGAAVLFLQSQHTLLFPAARCPEKHAFLVACQKSVEIHKHHGLNTIAI